MNFTYYLVHISATASELPHAITDFLHQQSCFHHLADHDLFLPLLPARRKASEASFDLCLVAPGVSEFAQQPFIHVHRDSTAA